MLRILALCSLVLATPAFAERLLPESPFCVTESNAKVQAADYIAAHPGVTMKVLNGDIAKAFADAYNAVPPVSDAKADEIWALRFPDYSAYVLEFIFEHKGCYTATVSEGAFIAIMAKVEAGRL